MRIDGSLCSDVLGALAGLGNATIKELALQTHHTQVSVARAIFLLIDSGYVVNTKRVRRVGKRISTLTNTIYELAKR